MYIHMHIRVCTDKYTLAISIYVSIYTVVYEGKLSALRYIKDEVDIHIYVYICIYVYAICTYICIYVYARIHTL